MANENAQWSQPFQLIPNIKTPDSMQVSSEEFAQWLECVDCSDPALRLLSHQNFIQELLTPEADPDGYESPMVYLARLLATDTLQELINTINALLEQIAPSGSD